MLTSEDLQKISDLIQQSIERAFEENLTPFAISVQQQFAAIDARFDAADRRADTFATKTDIARLEGILTGHNGRIDRLEDDVRVIKTKLKLA
ncbi:MAG: hypothetical protein RL150_524 [Candidatus Parcubacteria bacterium]|jgi:hypothetical protein